jgi:3-oxoacyl-[acyl-carrier protein] reductase
MNLGLKNKTVVITGGATGLGAAICAVFAEEGANTVVFDLGNPSPELVIENSLYVQGNVTRAGDIERALIEAEQRFGGIDILVNNAGIWPSAKVVNMADEEWEHTLQVNLGGAFMFSKRFVNYLESKKCGGQIINIVSPVAFQGSANGHSHYAAAKAGLVSFTRSLALETAESGIRVVAVAPGVMETGMTQSRLDNHREDYLKRIPIGRFIEPGEVARVVVFMASEMANCITGTTIDATGGMLGH